MIESDEKRTRVDGALDKAVLTNHLHNQCFDTEGNCVALRGSLLDSIFQWQLKQK